MTLAWAIFVRSCSIFRYYSFGQLADGKVCFLKDSPLSL